MNSASSSGVLANNCVSSSTVCWEVVVVVDGRGGVGTSSGVVVVGSGRSHAVVSLLVVGDIIIVITDMETKSGWVNVAVTEKEHGTEDWLGQNVEDTVEDGLAIWGDDISTLGQSPCNWVEEPKEARMKVNIVTFCPFLSS